MEQLVAKLIEKTENKMAVWDTTSRDNEFILNLEKSSITTDSWIMDNSKNCVDLNVRNDKGLIIYSIIYNDIDNIVEYDYLMNLHSLAKSSFYNIDDTVNDIFNELNSDKIIGKKSSEDNLPW